MPISIKAIGMGLAAILGAGAILLAGFGKDMWPIFLIAAILVFMLGLIPRLK